MEQLMELSQEVLAAILDFKREQASGVIEIHFSQGGVAKVLARVSKTYK